MTIIIILTPTILQVLTVVGFLPSNLHALYQFFLITLCSDYYCPYHVDEAFEPQRVQSTYLRLHSKEESEIGSKYKSDSL